jgi:hypothetical protein
MKMPRDVRGILLPFIHSSLSRDHDPQQQVDQQAGNATRKQGQEDAKAEPEGADPEELSKAATDTGNNTICARTTQGLFLICTHNHSPVLILYHVRKENGKVAK